MSDLVKIVDDIYPVGELPPLGSVPSYMHAWTLRNERLGDPADAFKEEIVRVPRPGKNEIIVANYYAGINYNGIWAALGKPKNVVMENGYYQDVKEDFHICGSESAGIIYDVGENVTDFKIGDEVIVGASQYDEDDELIKSGEDPVNCPGFHVWGYEGNWGAFAQFSKVYHFQCKKKPKNMSFAEGSVLTACGVPVYKMLTHWEGNKLKPGDVVLIYGGSGGVGSIAISLTRYLKGIPIAVVSDDERGRLCMELGAEGYINRKNFNHWGRLDDYLDYDKQRKWIYEAMRFKKEIWKIAGFKKSPAIVIEHPGADTMPTSVFVCDTQGMVVTCGATSSYLTDFDLRFLWLNQKRIQGCHSAAGKDFEGFIDVINKSGIRPYVGKVFKWEQLPYAHQLLYEGHGVNGRMTLKIV